MAQEVKERPAVGNAEFLNNFLMATYDALKYETGADLKKSTLTVDASPDTSHDITMMFGVIGEVRGYISLGMSENTAQKIACTLLKYDIRDIKMVTGAIYAMGQEISNRAGEYLNRQGLDSFATPPTIICRKGVRMAPPEPEKIAVRMESDFGSVELKVAVADGN